MTAKAQNRDGEWVPAIPEPFESGLKSACPKCGKTFWTFEGYCGHYALKHILKLGD